MTSFSDKLIIASWLAREERFEVPTCMQCKITLERWLSQNRLLDYERELRRLHKSHNLFVNCNPHPRDTITKPS